MSKCFFDKFVGIPRVVPVPVDRTASTQFRSPHMRIVRQSDDEALRGRPPPRDFVGASEKLEPYLKLRKVRGGTVPERPRYAETRASWAKPPAASDDGPGGGSFKLSP